MMGRGVPCPKLLEPTPTWLPEATRDLVKGGLGRGCSILRFLSIGQVHGQVHEKSHRDLPVSTSCDMPGSIRHPQAIPHRSIGGPLSIPCQGGTISAGRLVKT
jgi:hypothetical protein